MVGTWRLSGRQSGPDGEIRGQVPFEWMKGGFYLVQRAAIDYIGCKITGVEYMGYDDANGNLRSYFFGNEGPGPAGGVALEHVWEVDDDTPTIWGGEVGSRRTSGGGSATTATPSPGGGPGRAEGTRRR